MIDQSMTETIDMLLLESLKIMIPQTFKEDYDDGLASLTDGFCSFEMIDYFNGLQKMKLIANGITAALVANPERKEQSIQLTADEAGGNYSGVLDSDEFAEQGFNRPVAEQTLYFNYHVVKQGETLRSIADLYFGDWTYWVQIAKVNSLTESDLIDDDLIGEIIRIPVENSTNLIRGNNLVFEGAFDSASVINVQKYLYGRDLATENQNIKISGKNDLAVIEGLDCVVDNIIDLVSADKDSLNELHPNWGVAMPEQISDEPFFVSIEKMLVDMEQQVMSDARVLSAQVLRQDLQVQADALSVIMDVALIGGFSEQIEVLK